MDKQQKLEYQNKIEAYLTKEHIYDLFEDLLKQLTVKQPEDPISFLIEKLSAPQSTSPKIQIKKYLSLVHLDSKWENSLFKSQIIISLQRFLWVIFWKNKSRRNNNWARRLNLTLNTTR